MTNEPAAALPVFGDIEGMLRRGKRRAYFAFFAVVAVLLVIFGGSLIDIGQKAWFAYQNDIPFNRVELAEQQAALWQKNASCLGSFEWVPTNSGDKVSVQVCPSGDILVNVLKSDGREYYRWIPAESLSSASKS